MSHVICTPNKKWIPAAKVIAETVIQGEAEVSGFYKRLAGGICFYDLQGELFAFLVNNRHGIFFVTAYTTAEGTRFMHSTTSEAEKKLGIDGMGYLAQKELEQRIVSELETYRAHALLAKCGVNLLQFVSMANQEPTSEFALLTFFNAGMTIRPQGIEEDGYLLATSLGRSMLLDAGYEQVDGKWVVAESETA